jgi:hypothetical protein
LLPLLASGTLLNFDIWFGGSRPSIILIEFLIILNIYKKKMLDKTIVI